MPQQFLITKEIRSKFADRITSKQNGFTLAMPKSNDAEAKAITSARRKAIKTAKSAKAAALQRAAEQAEISRVQRVHAQRWADCLACLQNSVGELRQNPWLIILQPTFIHQYLDALTEVLANLSKHEDDIDAVRGILQNVYEGFVDLGRFAKYQPSFFITDYQTIRRLVRLLEQVAHPGSDKALFPNVLSLLGPTFEREEVYDKLAEANIVHSLMSFARTEWMPNAQTLNLLLAIIEQLSTSERLRHLFADDPGFDSLMQLAWGKKPGLTTEQQLAAQMALREFPAPQTEDETLARIPSVTQAIPISDDSAASPAGADADSVSAS